MTCHLSGWKSAQTKKRAKQAKRDEKRKLQEERTAQRKAQELGPEPEDGVPEGSDDKES